MASIANIIVYGQRATTKEHRYGNQVFEFMEQLAEALEPGVNQIVNFIPALRYLPASIAPFQRRINKGKYLFDKMCTFALSEVQERRARGDRRDCIAETILDELEGTQHDFIDDHGIQSLFGEMIAGGADTTYSALSTIILGLVSNQRVLKKAQEEVDRHFDASKSPNWMTLRNCHT